MKITPQTARLILIFIIMSICACSRAGKLLKADPAPPAGFIEEPQKLAEMREHAPFHGLWFRNREEFDRTRSKYKKIYFAEVSTEYVTQKGWWDDLNSADSSQYKKDLAEIAAYTRNTFEKAFREDPNQVQVVTREPDASTVIYRIAIVDLIATKAHINAAGTALGVFVPGGGLIKSAAKGSIAVEVKVVDGETQETIIAWSDREQDQSSLFSLSDFSWYSHARTAINTWAEQLVKLHNLTTKDKVEDSGAFTLNPF